MPALKRFRAVWNVRPNPDNIYDPTQYEGEWYATFTEAEVNVEEACATVDNLLSARVEALYFPEDKDPLNPVEEVVETPEDEAVEPGVDETPELDSESET